MSLSYEQMKTKIINKYSLKDPIIDKELGELIDKYSETFGSIKNLYQMFFNNNINDYSFEFSDNSYVNRFIKATLCFDNNLNMTNLEYVKCINDFADILKVYFPLNDSVLRGRYNTGYTYQDTDFDILNYIISKIEYNVSLDWLNHSGWEDGTDIYFELMFYFALYKNLSLILGNTFDINNYDYDSIMEVIDKYIEDFYKGDIFDNAMDYSEMNNLYDISIDNFFEYLKIIYEYMEEYIKNILGENKKRIIK